MTTTNYFTELLGVDGPTSLQMIESIERSLQTARAAATLHEFGCHAYSELPEHEAWRPLSELDKEWWLRVSERGMLPQGSWRENGLGAVQISPWKLRFDQLPPSVMLHFYLPQASAILHAMAQPGVSLESISKAAFETMYGGSYEDAEDEIKLGFRKVSALVVHALGVADAIQSSGAN